MGPAGLRTTVPLEHRPPAALGPLVRFLGHRAVAGLEEAGDGWYRRALRLAHGAGVATLALDGAVVRAELDLDDARDLDQAVAGCRRILDLDTDPGPVDAALGADPDLAPLVAAVPGRRVPGHVDPAELVVRAVLGQQVSVVGARTLTARLVARCGAPLARPVGAVDRLFPGMDVLADADLAGLGLTGARQRAIRAVAAEVASGRLVLRGGAERAASLEALGRLPGIGPWTTAYVGLRALGDRDGFMPSDLGVRRALEQLGLPADPAGAARHAERWRPWRAYAMAHLWALADPELAAWRADRARPDPTGPAPG